MVSALGPRRAGLTSSVPHTHRHLRARYLGHVNTGDGFHDHATTVRAAARALPHQPLERGARRSMRGWTRGAHGPPRCEWFARFCSVVETCCRPSIESCHRSGRARQPDFAHESYRMPTARKTGDNRRPHASTCGGSTLLSFCDGVRGYRRSPRSLARPNNSGIGVPKMRSMAPQQSSLAVGSAACQRSHSRRPYFVNAHTSPR